MSNNNETNKEALNSEVKKQGFTELYQKNRKAVNIAAGALLAVLLIWFTASLLTGGAFSKSLGVDESFDSVVAILPKKSQIIARYPDDTRHSLYYLNSGAMYCFDGKTKLLEQVTINNLEDAYIEKAELSEDEQYITMWVTAGEQKMMFRLNSMNGNIVDISDQRPADKDNMQPDEPLPTVPSVKKEEPATTTDDKPAEDMPSIDETKPAPEHVAPAPTQTPPPAPANTGGGESSD